MTHGDVIEYLVAHGAYVEAARICVERGEKLRAIRLYERVWRFADAVPLALELGDRPMAVRLALDANLLERATDIADSVPAEARAELMAVAEALAGRGRPFEAAASSELVREGALFVAQEVGDEMRISLHHLPGRGALGDTYHQPWRVHR